jgi:hypothetical protein
MCGLRRERYALNEGQSNEYVRREASNPRLHTRVVNLISWCTRADAGRITPNKLRSPTPIGLPKGASKSIRGNCSSVFIAIRVAGHPANAQNILTYRDRG